MATDINTLTKEKIKLDEPGLYDVIFLNDNITTMEFVIKVLKQIFGKTPEQAQSITRTDKALWVHTHTKSQSRKALRPHLRQDRKIFHYKSKSRNNDPNSRP